MKHNYTLSLIHPFDGIEEYICLDCGKEIVVFDNSQITEWKLKEITQGGVTQK